MEQLVSNLEEGSLIACGFCDEVVVVERFGLLSSSMIGFGSCFKGLSMYYKARLVFDAFKLAQTAFGCKKLIAEPLTVVSLSDGDRSFRGVGIKDRPKGTIVRID